MKSRRRSRFAIGALSTALLGGVGLHFAVSRAALPRAPQVSLPAGTVQTPQPNLRVFGKSYALRREQLLEVGLAGTPEQIGYAHARLLYPEMVENEGILLRRFSEQVSFAPARWILLDLAQLRYRNIEHAFSRERKLEIAAGARGFQPDPFATLFPTYQRFIYLNALYDISLSFEHSPLIGCTTFVLNGSASQDGHALLARAFDFEVDEVFDRGKAVFFVREDGQIPFASVAWPGLVGVMSGMNLAGLAVVVHGGRAGDTRAEGEPVVHALRRVLSSARTTDEAVAAFALHSPLVSHIVIASDAQGHAVRIERVPGRPVFASPLPDKAAVTNHFEGPSAADPKNIRVREATSTLPRRQRGDELLAALHEPASVADAVGLLRDRRGPGGVPLALGDRRAIDALIATHGVVMDSTARVLWVSVGPHLLGRFVAFDLNRQFAADYDPAQAAPLPAIGADALLTSGEYARKHASLR